MRIVLLLPELILTLMILACFCMSLAKTKQAFPGKAALICSVLALLAACATFSANDLMFYKAYKIDAFSQMFKILINSGLILILWFSAGLTGINRQLKPEYYLFMGLSCLGLFIMVSAVELLTIIVSLEISSYALFVLIPLRRHPQQREPLEASIKYVFFGGVATGLSLYGMSYIFGAGHSTYLADLVQVMPGLLVSQPLAVIGLVMLLCGLFYKLALFPMHFWMPDVFVGAAHETSCFIATLPKIGAVALLVRFISMAGGDSTQLTLVVSAMALLSMTLGNLSALGQQDIKRLLAYSSIAHAGYIMVGIISLNRLGLGASVYYLYGYILMNIACFYVIYSLAPEGENLSFENLKGLYKRSPLLAATLAIGAIGLSGIPPTIGFTGKFLIFTAALQKGFYWLVGLAICNVCISAFYYLRIVRAAYSSVEQPGPRIELSLSATLFGVLLIAAIILNGLFPQQFLRPIMEALVSIR